jgi:two-component system, chemotaxis family, protein-glutamate methylesterase/glutaminase
MPRGLTTDPGPRIVAIGASAGGLEAVKVVLAGLPAGYPWPVLVLLHASARYGGSQLDQLLQRCCSLPVHEAQPRQAACPGTVYLAPAGYHLLLERDLRFSLSVDEKVSYSRPSIDVLFDSVADACGAGAVGVILTGANDDGAGGLAAIRARGGLAIVQDPAEAQAPQMPRAALAGAGVDHVLRLQDIAAKLAALPGEESR